MRRLGTMANRAAYAVSAPFRQAKMRRLGMAFYPPNYIYFDRFNEESIVADVGCGFEAEFSRHMIERHRLRAFGVDPTRKHRPHLAHLEATSGGRFRHLPLAVSAVSGTMTFHESRQNESGSLLSGHTNVVNDEIVTYEVESVTLGALQRRLGPHVDLLKLDLEGAEYGLFEQVEAADLSAFRQIFLECHHHCTEHSVDDTRRIVKRIAAAGFDVFTLDGANFLFYR